MVNIAACLLTFDRPHYLRDSIERLEMQTEKDEVDWYLFQDGAYNPYSETQVAKQRDIDICYKILQNADLPNKEIIQNEHNKGIALQYASVLELLDGEYDAVVTFEDDVLVSRYALRLSRVIMMNFPQHVPTIYSSPERMEVDDIDDNLDLLIRCRTAAFHTAAITSRIYEHIKDRYRDYIDMISEVDYRMRDHERIKDEFGSRVSSHDSVFNKLLVDFGYERIKPAVTRAIYIGMEGLHHSSDSFMDEHRYSSSDTDYEVDRHIINFRSTQSKKDLF